MTLGSQPDRRTPPGAERGRLVANVARMRSEVPPPGRAMTFPEWARAIVDGVRAFLPDATAVRKGRRLVIIRHGDRAAMLANDGSFWVTFTADDLNIKTTMCSLVDDRRDEFTAGNLAHSILMRVRNLVSLFRRNPFSYRDSPY
jgi:hypothetical protein